MSKALEILRSLTGLGPSYAILLEFSKTPGVPQLGTTAPHYRAALELFNERYPERVNENKWTRLRQGFNLAFEEFHDEFQRNLDLLVADKENRIIYLNRTAKKLYNGPGFRNDRMQEFASYFQSESFKGLKGKLGQDIWDELDTIGYAALQRILYSKALDNLLEHELKMEGVPMKYGWSQQENDGELNPKQDIPVINRSMNKIIEIVRPLLKPQGKSYSAIMQLNKIIEQDGFSHIAPNYDGIFNYFDECYPHLIHEDREEKISIGFRDIVAEYRREFDSKIDELTGDKDNRIAFLKRLYKEIYVKPHEYKKLAPLGDYIYSSDFLKLRPKLSSELGNELKELGMVASLTTSYGCFISAKIEEYLEIEGIYIEDGWIRKSPVGNTNQPNYNNPRSKGANSKSSNPIYKSFEELFTQPTYLAPCIDALYRIRPDKPVISETSKWQKRDGSKAILAAWIRRMEDCDKIEFIRNKKQLVPLLNAYFPGLDLGVDARTLKDPDPVIVLEFSALILP